MEESPENARVLLAELREVLAQGGEEAEALRAKPLKKLLVLFRGDPGGVLQVAEVNEAALTETREERALREPEGRGELEGGQLQGLLRRGERLREDFADVVVVLEDVLVDLVLDLEVLLEAKLFAARSEKPLAEEAPRFAQARLLPADELRLDLRDVVEGEALLRETGRYLLEDCSGLALEELFDLDLLVPAPSELSHVVPEVEHEAPSLLLLREGLLAHLEAFLVEADEIRQVSRAGGREALAGARLVLGVARGVVRLAGLEQGKVLREVQGSPSVSLRRLVVVVLGLPAEVLPEEVALADVLEFLDLEDLVAEFPVFTALGLRVAFDLAVVSRPVVGLQETRVLAPMKVLIRALVLVFPLVLRDRPRLSLMSAQLVEVRVLVCLLLYG